tara:strand:+ start:36 stop:239 length:204 start_codon:yes stop_codon:yes gene_type:complete
MAIARRSAMFNFDKDENIAISHYQVKLTPFHVMILRDEGESLLAQPLSSYLLNGGTTGTSGMGVIRH